MPTAIASNNDRRTPESRTMRAALLACAVLLGACATPARYADVDIVAMNDFHGNLESSTFKYTGAADHAQHVVQAGGIDTLAAALQAWRKEDDQLLLVGAGDLVGASPPMSSLWADEPSIEALSLLGLRTSSVGNHEFDQGRAELLRQQRGGCDSPRPDKACRFAASFGGATFSYLAANVIDKASGKPFLPAYRIEQAHGVKIAFIGAVLKDTASLVLPSGIAGLEFTDEADSINRVLPELRAQGVGVFVVLIHQGGHTDESPEQPDCRHLQGPIVAVVKRLDPAIRLVVSGHTHTGYTCNVEGRVVTQADMGGHMLTRIRLSIDRAGNTVHDISARNVVMLPGEYPHDAAMDTYLNGVRERSRVALSQPVARIGAATLTRELNRAGESALGDLVADAMLAATRAAGAQIAFVNNGSLRTDLESAAGNVVNEGQVRSTLPFGNTLVTMSLSGKQIRSLLEQQWGGADGGTHAGLLQVSAGFHYRWDAGMPAGDRVRDIALNGQPLEDERVYRIVVNNFLAGGGDNFSLFTQGSDRSDSGVTDLDTMKNYLRTRDADGKPAGRADPGIRIESRQ